MVKCICLVKAKPGQTAEEFKKRWIEGHTQFAASWKNIKSYTLNFPLADVHEKQGMGPMFDGIGELVWDSYEDMVEDFNSERGKLGFADAAEFMDLPLSLYFEEIVVELKK